MMRLVVNSCNDDDGDGDDNDDENSCEQLQASSPDSDNPFPARDNTFLSTLHFLLSHYISHYIYHIKKKLQGFLDAIASFELVIRVTFLLTYLIH